MLRGVFFIAMWAGMAISPTDYADRNDGEVCNGYPTASKRVSFRLSMVTESTIFIVVQV